MRVDVIIVGQGIAGTCLALNCLENGVSILIVDDPKLSTASKVSAGMFTPILGKRFSISWQATDVFPSAFKFYGKYEKRFRKSFIDYRNTARLFSSCLERDFFNKRSEDLLFKSYVDFEFDSKYFNQFKSEYGGFFIRSSGFFNMQLFLSSANQYFQDLGIYLEQKCCFDQIKIMDEQVRYSNIYADKIIFAEGFCVSNNPFFEHLPFKHAKSEVLILKSSQIDCSHVVNKGLWLKPLGNDLYMCGSTHDWNILDDEPSDSAYHQLREGLESMVKVPFNIVSHLAAVKPIIRDRMPIIGFHPLYPQIGILNGLGTKGAVSSPYFSDQLVRMMKEDFMPDRKVDIHRFF